MRESLLQIVRCPTCGDSGFDFYIIARNDAEIRDGKVLCRKCETNLEIREGILDTLTGFENEIVKKEQECSRTDHYTAEERKRILNDEFVLGNSLEDPWPHFPRRANHQNFLGLLMLLDLREDDTVLDVGSGTCWSTCQLALRKYRTVALDINRDRYMGLGAADIHFSYRGVYFERVVGDMSSPAFRDCAFDYVLSNASVHHTSDLKKTFEAFYHMLKPRGSVAMCNEPVAGFYRQLFPDKVYLASKQAGANENQYPLSEWRRVAEEVGFRFALAVPDSVTEKLRQRGIDLNELPARLRNVGDLFLVKFYKTLLILRGGSPLMLLYKGGL